MPYDSHQYHIETAAFWAEYQWFIARGINYEGWYFSYYSKRQLSAETDQPTRPGRTKHPLGRIAWQKATAQALAPKKTSHIPLSQGKRGTRQMAFPQGNGVRAANAKTPEIQRTVC